MAEVLNGEVQSREIIAQLSPGDMLGTQKSEILAAMIGSELMLGTVLGQARGLSYRNNPQDENKPSVALMGPFKFVPFKMERSELRAIRCYLPTTIHEAIVQAMQGDNPAPIEKSPRRGASVDINLGAVLPVVLEIGVRRVESAVGYEYITREVPKFQMAMNDPLAELQAAVAATGKMIAPPEGVKRLAAPAAEVAPAKGGSKKKR